MVRRTDNLLDRPRGVNHLWETVVSPSSWASGFTILRMCLFGWLLSVLVATSRPLYVLPFLISLTCCWLLVAVVPFFVVFSLNIPNKSSQWPCQLNTQVRTKEAAVPKWSSVHLFFSPCTLLPALLTFWPRRGSQTNYLDCARCFPWSTENKCRQCNLSR